MKKVILILVAALTLVACKNKNQNNIETVQTAQTGPNDTTTTEVVNKPIVIDTTSFCYKESFVYDVLVTHNDNTTKTLKGLTEQPMVTECPKGVGSKWCLIDDEKDELLASDIKSYKVLVQRFDTTKYFICHDNGNR
jgi:hypothetical protein